LTFEVILRKYVDIAVVQRKGAKMKATTKDLRLRTKELLETVSRGEEVVITCRGKPCAKLVPFENKIGRKAQDGSVFSLKAKVRPVSSPFYVEGIKTKATTQDILDAISRSRIG